MKRIYASAHGEILECDDKLLVLLVDEDGDPVSMPPSEVYHLMRTLQEWLKANGHPHGGN